MKLYIFRKIQALVFSVSLSLIAVVCFSSCSVGAGVATWDIKTGDVPGYSDADHEAAIQNYADDLVESGRFDNHYDAERYARAQLDRERIRTLRLERTHDLGIGYSVP